MAAQELLDPALPPGHPPIPTNQPGGAMPNIEAPPAPSGAETLAWQLPKGWNEARSGGMRLATLKPPVQGKIDVSVIMLPGTAGGDLANVNRWRGQIGLPPVDEAGREKIREEVKAKAGVVSLYDFANEAGDKQRMLAGSLFVDGRTWFIKMVGDGSAVASARKDFVSLLGSLHFPAGK
jgi:hypothetical protein